ncbi:sigma-70 family RNA polymerase sigma factor [Parachitinimonas caeni]|uniref:Sigma-70 family RNA polymerase sigma factor n=1 Tax=Parachitinimonas caeni TaxID=3031301 RepID=A0ABT7DYK0_9NEIS|nr:sigma-70 family RNA polymerase sigma factor [Parachitinimonas caeni]MDK2125135.1 sigma-70 family RNA polymerase sigma factor [Parachitinimonas caeni]
MKKGKQGEQVLEATKEAELWRAWIDHRDQHARERLIDGYIGYARILAAKTYASRTYYELEFSDYMQYASIGLIEAIDRYQPNDNATFTTYASKRIIGAILSGVEQLSEMQQQVAFRRRFLAERTQSLVAEGAGFRAGPEAVFEELAKIALGLALGFALEDSGMILEDEETPHPEEVYTRVELRQLQRRVVALVNRLPDRERKVIRHHYLHQLPLEDIASLMNVGKSRVSQIHRKGLDLLRLEIKQIRACDVAW